MPLRVHEPQINVVFNASALINLINGSKVETFILSQKSIALNDLTLPVHIRNRKNIQMEIEKLLLISVKY